jgi:hypothetical protein
MTHKWQERVNLPEARLNGGGQSGGRLEPAPSNLAPAPLGNRRAAKHGAYVTRFSPAELAEISELEDELRSLSPLDSHAIEPAISLVAGQLWRRERLFRDLNDHGITRGRADRGKVAPSALALETLERSILEGLKALALTPQSAASLGLTLAKARNANVDYDLERLSDAEQAQLQGLLEKARYD